MRDGTNSTQVKLCNTAEGKLIGSILIDPETTLPIVREILKPGDFSSIINEKIFIAMCQLEDQAKPIDVATICSHLYSDTLFNEIDGVGYLIDCENTIPSAINVTYYAKLIRTDSIRKKISLFGNRLRAIDSSKIEDIDLTISQLSDELLSLASGTTHQPWQDFKSALKEAFDELQKDDETPLITGFVDLDAKMSSLKPGLLTVIAARPAMGKTAFGLNLLTNISFDQKVPAAFFSLEMTTSQLIFRVLSSQASVNGTAISKKRMSEDEWGRLIEVMKKYIDSKIYIDQTPGLDIALLRERARRLKKTYGIGILIVDYLQLMHASEVKSHVREQEIAAISQGLKGLAKELNIPIIALAQLNRALNSRTDKRPIMSDLRESGAIEQDSDCVMFIHREDYYRTDGQNDNEAEIIIAKQRSGPTGTVKLHWTPEYSRFSNLPSHFDDAF